MKTLKKIMYTMHRVLGIILSILFLVWFLSGFVMIYHTYPKVIPRDNYKHMDVLQNNDLQPIDSIVKPTRLKSLLMRSVANKTYFEIATTKNDKYRMPADSNEVLTINYTDIESYAQRWCKADIAKVDTLYELDQWIPFGQLKKHFPIYKFHFSDDEDHQLYVSSQTGDALQFTNESRRMWAWLGAIPHWVYFTSLRQNSQLWVDVVVWLSGIGCIMCLSGIVIGIRSYYKQFRQRKRLKTPYRKFVYKWHHILGFVFGIFVFTFAFSGMMSLADVPQWAVKTHDKSIQKQLYASKEIDLDSYKLDYRKLFEFYPDQVKSIEWSSFGAKPIYKAIVDNRLLTIDASQDEVKLLALNEEDIEERLTGIHCKPLKISTMTEFDNYYVGLTDHLPLPVYKVVVDDDDNSTYYINPKNGSIRYFNTNSKIHRWTYQGLHSYKFKFLAERPILWNVAMWTTMIGGTLVSLTGVWLSARYFRRKLKKIINNKDKC